MRPLRGLLKVKVKVKLQFIVHTRKAAVANVTDSMEYYWSTPYRETLPERQIAKKARVICLG